MTRRDVVLTDEGKYGLKANAEQEADAPRAMCREGDEAPCVSNSLPCVRAIPATEQRRIPENAPVGAWGWMGKAGEDRNGKRPATCSTIDRFRPDREWLRG